MKKYLKFILCLLFLSISLSKDKLPKTFLKDLKDKKVDVFDVWDNGPMAINFWFLACGPCKKEMKFLNEFHKKYEKDGFKVLSVTTDNSRTLKQVRPYVKSQGYVFPVFSDPKEQFFRKLGGKVCPFLVLVDHDGNIVQKHSGYNPGDEVKLEKEIKELLIAYNKVKPLEQNIQPADSIQLDSTKVEEEIPLEVDSIKVEEEIPLEDNEEQ